MKSSDQSPKNKPEKSTLNDLLKQGAPERNDETAEEFITPDPTRTAPDENVEQEKTDSMGIKQDTKNQASEE